MDAPEEGDGDHEDFGESQFVADALESEGDELSTSVTMSKLIAVAPRAKAFLSALFVEAHCTIAITSETHASD